MAKLAIFTEAEARERWCPFAKIETGNNRSIEVDMVVVWPFQCRCMASTCMAWRWFDTNIQPDGPGTDLVPSGETYGYCGLAGSPEAMRPWMRAL